MDTGFIALICFDSQWNWGLLSMFSIQFGIFGCISATHVVDRLRVYIHCTFACALTRFANRSLLFHGFIVDASGGVVIFFLELCDCSELRSWLICYKEIWHLGLHSTFGWMAFTTDTDFQILAFVYYCERLSVVAWSVVRSSSDFE